MKKIPLTRGKFALVDDEDFEELNKHKWYASAPKGKHYAMRTVNGADKRNIFMHRQIMEASKGEMIDHADGDGLNNQKLNLRFCTYSENMQNQAKRKDNKTGYKGVDFHKKTGKYRAQIRDNGRKVCIGLFSSPLDAAKAYNKKAIKLFGEFAKVNIIPADKLINN